VSDGDAEVECVHLCVMRCSGKEEETANK